MTLIDTFFDGRDIYEKDGFYYVVKYGRIISPAFATLKDAQDQGWKYDYRIDQNKSYEDEIKELKEPLSETLDVIEENSRLSEAIGRERVLRRNNGLIKRIKEVLK